MNEWINEWSNELMNDRMNELTNEWLFYFQPAVRLATSARWATKSNHNAFEQIVTQ